MREPSPTPVNLTPIAITKAKHHENSLPFLLWLFGTPLIILFQVFSAISG